MILSYIKDKKPYTKINIIKFWKGYNSIKFEFKNGEIIEVKDVNLCFIKEEDSNI